VTRRRGTQHLRRRRPTVLIDVVCSVCGDVDLIRVYAGDGPDDRWICDCCVDDAERGFCDWAPDDVAANLESVARLADRRPS